MAVPENIRRVERPKNTIVDDSGRDGPFRYAVRERSSTKYVPGGNPQPRNGKVIGHIIGGKYVPVNAPSASSGPDMLSYGSSALVKSVSSDLFDDLLAIYSPMEAYQIISMASLKVIKPQITLNRMSTHYKRTFISVYYPGTSMSKNSVGELIQKIGEDGNRRRLFYERRMKAVCAEHHIAIDGTLKQNTSSVNDLSAFSYKARVKGCQEISVLYAYDIELKEPICSQVFPGNSIDASSYSAFIRDNDIKKGIIISDKGFPPAQIQSELKERPELHFMTPIKRNDKRINKHGLLDFEGVLKGVGAHVLYKKTKVDDKYFYSFKDVNRAANEEVGYVSRTEKKGNFDLEKYEKKSDLFGVIIFESDVDIEPRTAYECYDDRWMLELVFNRYKSDECLDRTNVQGDFSVIGMEFVYFISTVITCRILQKARNCGLLENMSYGDLMDDLSSAWRKEEAPSSPKSNDNYWVHTLLCVFEELEALGLSEPVPKAEQSEPKEKGGKPKEKNPETDKPKRPRGRPRKNNNDNIT